jgi:hypothetical protein
MNFLARHTNLGSFCCINFFVNTRRFSKVSFTEIYLIENVVIFQVYFGGLLRFAEPFYLQFSENSFSVASGGDENFFSTKFTQFFAQTKNYTFHPSRFQ